MIDEEAFYGCEQLDEVELCEELEEIGESAFFGCKSLTCFKSPSTLKMIGSYAFQNCEILAEVELVKGCRKSDGKRSIVANR